MKLFSTSHVFPFPWHTLTCANWRKYPNEKAQHVISCDVLDRFVDSNGVLHTERLIVCKQNVPTILKKLGVQDVAYFHEVSTLDPSQLSYEATTTNLSLTNVCTVEETCSFNPDLNNPENTVFQQKGHVIAVKALSTLGRFIEDAAVKRFYANAHVGRQALQLVVDRVIQEARDIESSFVNGIDNLKREWSENVGCSIDEMAGRLDNSLNKVTSSMDTHFKRS